MRKYKSRICQVKPCKGLEKQREFQENTPDGTCVVKKSKLYTQSESSIYFFQRGIKGWSSLRTKNRGLQCQVVQLVRPNVISL